MASHAAPAGPYERDGATVYKLTVRSSRGINQFTARVEGQTVMPEVSEAIAKLFQAAPDLLAACKRAHTCMTAVTSEAYRVETEKMLSAAIAKATE